MKTKTKTNRNHTTANTARRAYVRTKRRLAAGTHKLEFLGATGTWINAAPTAPSGKKLNSSGTALEMHANLLAAKMLRPGTQWRVRAIPGGSASIVNAVNRISRRVRHSAGKEAA